MPLVVLGVDPHKQSHTATALVVGSHQQLTSLRVPASPAGYQQLLSWARQFPQRQWAVENARGLGCHLTQWLLARRESVQDVRTTATARVRELSRGCGRKTDALDAAAAAAVAALQGDAAQLQPEDATVVLAVLEERRSNLVGQRTRSVNQLHAVLRELIAGGAPRKLRAHRAAELLRAVRPVTAADRARKQVARELVAEIRGLDRQLAAIGKRLQDAVTESSSRLPQTVGVGPVIAGRLLGRTGRAARFPPRPTLPATPARPRSRSPAENTPDTGYLALVTASSTMPCTSSPWSRPAAQAAPATTTSAANSPKARPLGKPCAASSAGSPITSGASCSPTNKPANTPSSKRFDTQRRPRP
jgi:transposase